MSYDRHISSNTSAVTAALAAFTVDYTDIGRQTADLAAPHDGGHRRDVVLGNPGLEKRYFVHMIVFTQMWGLGATPRTR